MTTFRFIYFSILFSLLLFVVSSLSASAVVPTYDNVHIPMSDGKFLAADIYLPSPEGKYPTIYIHTPYKKENFVGPLPFKQLALDWLDTKHYAYVVCDWRGFYGSTEAAKGGKKINLGRDGYEVIEWIAQQKWSNGKVGLWGHSAPAEAAYRIATEQPPHLVCLVPSSARIGSPYTQFYINGIPRDYYIKILTYLGFNMTGGIDRATQHPLYNWLWKISEKIPDSDKIDIPLLAITGWYDTGCESKIWCFYKIKTPKKKNSDHMKLIIGPWEHLSFNKSQQGCLDFAAAKTFAADQTLRFFDYYLRDLTHNGWDKEAPIRYFQMAGNHWLNSSIWPPHSERHNYYLHQNNNLSTSPPVNHESKDVYTYDPNHPYPTLGGAYLQTNMIKGAANIPKINIDSGPQDISKLNSDRKDHVIYTSSPLDKNLSLAGEIQAKLYVSSNCNDTDFVVRLADVYPDGRAFLITDGVKRMSITDSCTASRPIIPGKIYCINITFLPTAQTFLKDHKLQLVITSSSTPAITVNDNVWQFPIIRQIFKHAPKIATNTIYHDKDHASSLSLPITQ
jgi:predicted acyl esterase